MTKTIEPIDLYSLAKENWSAEVLHFWHSELVKSRDFAYFQLRQQYAEWLAEKYPNQFNAYQFINWRKIAEETFEKSRGIICINPHDTWDINKYLFYLQELGYTFIRT